LTAEQLAFDLADERVEDARFLTDQLITYIGNKRALLKPIDRAVASVADRIGRPLHTLDAFSGSGVVSRLLKRYSGSMVVNDIEPYAAVLSHCYLANRESVPVDQVEQTVNDFNMVVEDSPSTGGFIEELYAPRRDDDIQLGERVFYTRDNARRLDHFAKLIRQTPETIRPFLLAPLLSAASIHANTAGVFKGFYKDRNTGIGRFGGAGQDALARIKGKIQLQVPVLSEFSAEVSVHTSHANDLVRQAGPLDLAYFDPPYNQHPYGSNYFMLNLLTKYEQPSEISEVSGIPTDWQRSNYNVRKMSREMMRDLVEATDARFLLISFNDEGFIEPETMLRMLSDVGEVTEYQVAYNTFRGSRNLRNRNTHVTEHLYLVEKG
jgi:adenine-specific DNA-methyltransferase